VRTRLDAGLLVAAEDSVERVEALVLPVALVQVQDNGGLGEEVRRAGEDPVLVLPGLDGVGVEDLPDRGAANRLVQLTGGASGQVGGGLPTQGFPVRATTSQAMEATMALSRGGKGGLAASPGGVFEGKIPSGPALPPAADAVGVEVQPGGEIDVGDQRVLVQEQHQLRPLPQMRGRCARRDQPPGFAEELSGENRAIVRRRSGHVIALLDEQSLYPPTAVRQSHTHLPNGPLRVPPSTSSIVKYGNPSRSPDS
jgi:hypothetical protein